MVSSNTERRLEGYFRREWSYAIDRARNMADDALFIMPVFVDALDQQEARIPDRFKSVHITELPGGEPAPAFVQRLQQLLSGRDRGAS